MIRSNPTNQIINLSQKYCRERLFAKNVRKKNEPVASTNSLKDANLRRYKLKMRQLITF